MGIANLRKGIGEVPKPGPKQAFEQSTVKSFRQRMMEEEKKDLDDEKKDDPGFPGAISCGYLPKPDLGLDRAQSEMTLVIKPLKDSLV